MIERNFLFYNEQNNYLINHDFPFFKKKIKYWINFTLNEKKHCLYTKHNN